MLTQNKYCKVYRSVTSLLTLLVIFHTQEPSMCKLQGQPFFKKSVMFSSNFVQCTCRPCSIDMNLRELSSQFHCLYSTPNLTVFEAPDTVEVTNFIFMWPCIVTNFFLIKPTDALISKIYFCQENLHVSGSSCAHHQEFSTVHSALVYVMQFWWRTAVPNVQWKTPDDGQRNCQKHVDFLDKNKFWKLVRLLVLLKRNVAVTLILDLQKHCYSRNWSSKNWLPKLVIVNDLESVETNFHPHSWFI
jgi:hypothetical protein